MTDRLNTGPVGWSEIPLSDAGEWIGGGTPAKSNPAFWDGDIPWVSPKDMKSDEIRDTEDHITLEAVGASATRVVPAKSVVMVVRSGILRHSFPVAVTRVDAALNQDLKALVPVQGIDAGFLRFQLNARADRILRDCSKSGTTVQSIEFPALLSFVIRIAPIDEQHRIVDEIEKQFTRLDAAVAALKRVRANLKRYRASALEAACEGRLLALTPEYVKKARPTLPAGWTTVPMGELAERRDAIFAGPFGTLFKAKDFRVEGIPIVFLRHVAPGKYLKAKPGFMDREKWEELFQPYSVYGGELLITKLGEPPGTCAVYPTGIGPAMVTPDVIAMKVDKRKAEPKYLMTFMNSLLASRLTSGAAFGTTRLRLTLPLFRDLPVPLPPLPEQQRIVAEVERRVSVVDQMEKVVETNLARASKLRRSVLKRAFEGRLIPQNPDDESAGVLLERIRANRGAGAPHRARGPRTRQHQGALRDTISASGSRQEQKQ